MERVSIKTIAEQLGISVTAVSLVLNGKERGETSGRVGKEMAEKIRQAAREMNYEPNNLARGLKMGRSETIGLVIADISNLFFANLAFHIQEHAEKFGYGVIITNTNESDLKMEKMTKILERRQVDGFIIVPTEYGEPYVRNLTRRNIPVVLIDRYYPKLNVSAVVIDNYKASREITNNLVESGCRHIGLIIYKSALHHMKERKNGYVDELKDHGLFNPSLIKEVSYSYLSEDIDIAIESLLMKDETIDGIFFATNTLSLMGLKRMLHADPQALSKIKVASFDKSDAFDFMHVTIPYIQQPIPEMGKSAVELLMKQIKTDDKEAVTIKLQAQLEYNKV
ncbi:MAG: LacI family transcriptional regulator [Dysgonamonadaceae bacterium]|jgi:LacI family transcriptional regulator|nr:LacI family transcriptional regulator [Dysgonamonadaceae bacterium]